MSTLKVANVHFDATGTNRIDYVSGDDIVRITSGAVKLPVGDTASRPTAEAGLIRYNSETGSFEGYNASAWGTIGGGSGGASSFSANVGNNSSNTFNVSHDLNKQFVIPAVRENSTGYYVYPDIKYTSVNTIELEFVTAPTTNQYTVIVLG